MKTKGLKNTSGSGRSTSTPSKKPSGSTPKDTTTNNKPLTKEEKAALEQCLATIKQGMHSYVAIGAAFKEIKDKELHREAKLPFFDYCAKVLGVSKAHVNRSIKASDCAKHIETSAPNGAVPQNEGSARVIAGLSPEEQVKVAECVKKSVGDAIPTAEDFKKAKDQVRPPKDKAPPKTKTLRLQETDTMSLSELFQAVDWARDVLKADKPKQEAIETLDEAVDIIQFFLSQNSDPDDELPAKPTKGAV